MVLQELSAEAAARPLTRSDIKMLQGRLWSLGFDPGTIDGIAGRRTLAALNRYRAGKSLDRVAHIDRAAVADLLN
jgi:lysozyme family protein